MRILLNPFKSQLGVLSFIAFLLLFTPVLTANEPATKPTSQEFKQKTAKLHMPFIANNGQMDEQVKFYAKTFGGTVFVTKEGEIVYALPMNSSECRGEWHSPNGIYDEAGMLHDHHISDILHPASWIVEHDKPETCGEQSRTIQNDALCHPECNEGSVALKRDSSPSAQNDREESTNRSTEPLTTKSETCGEQSRTIQNQKSGDALREEFVGSRVKTIQGEQPSVTKVSYFKGNDPSKWKTNISTYDSVNLGEIYDGIELKLRAYGNNVEKLFCVKPGADPEQIKIRLSGVKDYGVQNAEITHPLVPSREGINPKSDASTSLSMTSLRVESRNQNQKLQINKSGELEVETGLGTVKFTKPVAYQEIDGRRVEVEVEYSIQGTGIGDQEAGGKRREVVAEGLTTDNCSPTYGFTVASYDRTKDLIIDPLLASTFLGGSDNDYGRSLALDASGNVYVTGDTESLDFPTTGGVSDTSYNSVKDVFISKFDSGLSSLLVSTYLGGSDSDNVYCLYIDNNGNIYLTGSTASTDFPTTAGAYSISISDSNNVDAFISKLDSGLTTLIASTFLGGTKEDVAQSLIVDASGYVYAGGYTLSSNFPTTPGAYDTYNSSFYSQTFISKLNNGLNSLLASTFFGGGRNDYICSIVTDTSGSAYVSGQTYSTDFPTHTGSYDTSFNGDSSDAFVSKFNSMLTNLIASTFLGGYNEEKIQSMYLDSSGDVYITGWTYSSDFPTTPAAYDSLYNGSSEAFVSKLSGTLKNLLASTYLGGADDDSGYALVLDIEGNIYVTGLTSSSTFPITIGAYTTSFNGGSNDAFVSKLNGSLTAMLASTYLGGSSDDYINSVGIDSNENIYVAGITSSSNIPTTTNAYDTSYTGGGLDAFISKFDSNLSATTPSPSPAPTQIPTIITPEPTPTTTCTDTYESNDSFSTSYGPLTSEDSYSGKICDATDEDYFNITVESAGTISLSLVVPSNRDYDLYLHNPSQQLIAYSEEPAGETEIIESDVSETGIYYIKVNGFENDYDENQVYTLSGTWPSFIIPTPIPTDTKTPTPTSTPSPVSCDVATAITSSPSTVTVTKGNSTTVTVTVTGANGCAVTNDRVKATSNNTSIATVSPSKATTDANGQAVFTINGLKKGSAKVTFKETLSKLKVKVPVTVTK